MAAVAIRRKGYLAAGRIGSQRGLALGGELIGIAQQQRGSARQTDGNAAERSLDQFDVQEPAFQRHQRAARFGRTTVVNHLGQVSAAASRRSQQQDTGPRGDRYLGLGAGPPYGRRNADDPRRMATQSRLLPESLQLFVKFLRFAALVLGRRDFGRFFRAVLRIDQGNDAQDLVIEPAEGHEMSAAKQRRQGGL